MTELNQQEQELLDFLKENRQVLTLPEICRGLNRGTATIAPLLTSLVEKDVIKTWTGKGYPKAQYYCVKKP